MFPYVIVVRELNKEETEERARRWKLLFWLLLVLLFWNVVDAVFNEYKAVSFPHVFRFLVYAIVPATLAWLMVRYWRFLLGALLSVYLVMGTLQMVVALWQSTGG
jgi:hypothetical protein